MKHVLLSAAVAAAISIAVVTTLHDDAPSTSNNASPPAMPSATTSAGAAAPRLSHTDALVEDVWVNGARTPGDDHRTLTSAANSICFITKIEISGIQSAEDTSSCAMEIDDFTGFWDLVATVEEGSQSEIRCNARCLVWEQE